MTAKGASEQRAWQRVKELEAEIERQKDRAIRQHGRAEFADAESKRLRARMQDAKRCRDDAIGRCVEAQKKLDEMHDARFAEARRADDLSARLAKVVEAAKQLFTSIETIERQAEVLKRRVQDERPVEAILFECKRTRAALALAAAQPKEGLPECDCDLAAALAAVQPEEGSR